MPGKIYLLFVVFFVFIVPDKLSAGECKMENQEFFIEEQGSELAGSFTRQDNLFRRVFGIRKKTEAEKRSQSSRHSASRPERYTPPATGSQNPEAHSGRSRNLPSSDMSAVRNQPKAPLHNTMREHYYGLGIWEFGLSLGTSHAISDFGMGKGTAFGDFTGYQAENFGLNVGFFTRYRMNDWFALALGMDFLSLAASSPAPQTLNGFEVYRFTNDIFEFYTKTEFYMPGLSRSPFDLYGFVGIGVFFSDARVYNQDDRLVDMQIDYSQVQPVIPLGLGFSVFATPNFKIGYEFGWRNTIFHYLDGVKMDSDRYDGYFINGLKFSLAF